MKIIIIVIVYLHIAAKAVEADPRQQYPFLQVFLLVLFLRALSLPHYLFSHIFSHFSSPYIVLLFWLPILRPPFVCKGIFSRHQILLQMKMAVSDRLYKYLLVYYDECFLS